MKKIDFEKESLKRSYLFFEDWLSFWLPIYRKQILKAKFESDRQCLVDIKNNIMKNVNMDYEMKGYILKELGIKYLLEI